MILITAFGLLLGKFLGAGTQAPKPGPISLQAKTYTLTKPLEISGDGAVLDGHGAVLTNGGAAVAIHVNGASHVIIKNLKISGFGTGLSATGCPGISVIGVGIENCATGIQIDKTLEGLLQGISIHHCGVGVKLTGDSKLIVEKNDFALNRQVGILLSGSSSCIVRDNGVSSTGVDGKAPASNEGIGISVEGASSNNQILRNLTVRSRVGGIVVATTNAGATFPNTCDGNDVSWIAGGVGLSVVGDPLIKILNTTAGYCKTGILLSRVSGATVKGSLLVGCSDAGIEDDNGTHNSYDTNVFVKQSGGQVAIRIKGQPGIASDIQLYQNVFQEYHRPLFIENASPVTLQSNSFPYAPSVAVTDIAEVVGKAPLGLDSQNDKPKVSEFIPSDGPVAIVPTIYDRVGGISVSSSKPGEFELAVEGSLTGQFQGEEEVLATYKGELPIDLIFPPRFVAQVRVRVVGPKLQFAPFLALFGDNSMAKNQPTDDSGDTLFVPALAVDGDLTTPGHFWKPPHGKAGEWWEVDLKTDQIIDTVSVMAPPSAPDSFWRKFHVAISSTGLFKGEETTVATETDFTKQPGPIRYYHFPPVTARYIRVYGDQDQDGVQLQQFGVYGIKR